MPHEDAPPLRVAIVIPSDRAHSGERPDATGPALAEAARALLADVLSVDVVPDERVEIAAKIAEAADRAGADVVFVAGGTGLGPRDVTPEATMDAVDREAPGIAELIRSRSLEVTPRACLSRAVAGVRGTTLVIDLPGSPRGAVESLGFVAEVLPHAVAMLRGGGH
ncbi:MAG: MogA/MoaB family molybdenum cofactor biosynthesis protein [Planctomycetota bacterium]|jgi:molybdenum cofactor synthesis domain-containing protein